MTYASKSSLGSVWIKLFEIIYWHKHLWNYLAEPMEKAYNMFVFSLFPAVL
jgi:hypothetical protein